MFKSVRSVHDWVNPARQFFPRNKLSILEFGMGDGTEALLEIFTRVHSVEFAVDPSFREWFARCKGKFAANPRWRGDLVECPQLLVDAHMACLRHEYPADPQVAATLLPLVRPFLEERPDVIFVDSGLHLRADIVMFAFPYSHVVMAHDTSGSGVASAYGWARITPPPGHSFHQSPDKRVTFWIDTPAFDRSVR